MNDERAEFTRACAAGWRSRMDDPILAALDFPVWPDDYDLPG